MDKRRRKIVQAVGGSPLLLAGGVLQAATTASPQAADRIPFEAPPFAEAARSLGSGTPVESADVTLTSPDIAENGAVVPFTVASRVPATAQIALLVEKNPWIVAVSFGIPQGTEASVTTRVKMAETSRVIALVAAADGKLYYAAKRVKVTLGGCGG